MATDIRYFYLARVVLESRTPLSIAGGPSEDIFDVAIVRDANGLPAIPGTSIAGVLRHLYASHVDSDSADELFGFADRSAEGGQASRLHVSWGCIHDAKDQPVEGLLCTADERAKLKSDSLLKRALDAQPLFRDHVRLNHRGSVDARGKFDRTCLPAGYRFSVEFALWSDAQADERWRQLLGLLSSVEFRLGGATRRGYGAFKVVRCKQRCFDMRSPQDVDAYTGLSASLADSTGLEEGAMSGAISNDRWVSCQVKLQPEDLWRFGGRGEGVNPSKNGKTPDMLPVVEPVVEWQGNQGQFSAKNRIVIPASSVKGALAHRVAFHYNCIKGNFARAGLDLSAQVGEANAAVRGLFGFAKDSQEGEDKANTGRAGRVFLDDVYLDEQCVTQGQVRVGTMWHNSIDRFTGGVRDGMLYQEQLLQGAGEEGITVTVTLLTAGLEREPERADWLEALNRALQDLTEGRLALGAGSSKGHGYFRGSVEPANWLERCAGANR